MLDAPGGVVQRSVSSVQDGVARGNTDDESKSHIVCSKPPKAGLETGAPLLLMRGLPVMAGG